jgi:hypothetical protein
MNADTQWLQDELDARRHGEPKYGHILQLEPRMYALDDELVIEDTRPLTIRGHGRHGSTNGVPGSSVLVVTQPGKNSLSILNCGDVCLADFRIESHQVLSECGLLIASKPPYPTDAFMLERIRIDGKFSKAALFNLSVQSSYALGMQLYNYHHAPAMVQTCDNFWGAAIRGNVLPNVPAASSGWTYMACEWHNFFQGTPPYPDTWAAWFGGTSEVQVLGGNMSVQQGRRMLSLNGVPQGFPVESMLFMGCCFYRDDGSQGSSTCQLTGWHEFIQCKGHRP